MSELRIEYHNPNELKPYENNARDHKEEDIEAIRESIREFGFNDPIGIWSDENLIVEGHGRQLAAIAEGLDSVPCIRLDHLTDEQRRAYALAHNKTAELSGWDFSKLEFELTGIQEIDMAAFGFNPVENTQSADWFENRERDDDSEQEGNDEYNDFLHKFEQPKTTDDCYTPDIVYDAVADWVSAEYGYKREKMVRPFYPGGDYQKEKYADGCVVVDNPPFSILSEIRNWYQDHGIKYFLFAPALSCIGGNSAKDCAIATQNQITYENKASVPTSFVTNLDTEHVLVTAPELRKAVQDAADEYAKKFANPMPKYSYPSYVITAAQGGYLSKYGQDLKINRKDAEMIRALDMQREQDKTIYGGGYLLSEKAAAEKAAAEKAAATVWLLSDREKEIVKKLSDRE